MPRSHRNNRLARMMMIAMVPLLAALGAIHFAQAQDAPKPAAKAEEKTPAPQAGHRHAFLACGSETYILDEKGTVTWRYDGSTREGCVLPSGNILLAVSKSKLYPGGAAIELTRDDKIVFVFKGSQSEVNSVQLTKEGRYMVTEAGPMPRLLEIDKEGHVVKMFPLACQKENHHMQTRMARKQADGTYLAPHLLDFAIKRYSADGKVIATIDTTIDPEHKIHSWPFTAITTEKGNILAGLTHSHMVREFTPEGKVVWELTNKDLGANLIKDACGIQRLPNGNTVVAPYASGGKGVKLFEVTPDKKIVWKHEDEKKHGIHHFHIFQTDGKPLTGDAMR